MARKFNFKIVNDLARIAKDTQLAREVARDNLVSEMREDNKSDEEIILAADSEFIRQDFWEIAKIVYDNCPPAVACVMAEKIIKEFKNGKSDAVSPKAS